MNLKSVNYNDLVYSKNFTAFNGYNDSIGAKISVVVDAGGVIRPGNETCSGAVPCKIQFFTANDNGKLQMAGEFDKAGRFITHEHWSVTRNPSGNPLVLVLNSEEPGNGPSVSLRRSRGTYLDPLSVKENDSIFKISWQAHDGQSYKESSSIESRIDKPTELGVIPSSLVFNTFDNATGKPSKSLVINSDKTVSISKISSLIPTESVLFEAPLTLKRFNNEYERDLHYPTPTTGTMIFLINVDTVQIFTQRFGWKNLW